MQPRIISGDAGGEIITRMFMTEQLKRQMSSLSTLPRLRKIGPGLDELVNVVAENFKL